MKEQSIHIFISRLQPVLSFVAAKAEQLEFSGLVWFGLVCWLKSEYKMFVEQVGQIIQ